MWLESLEVENFRSCSTARLRLDPYLTLLVGENDAGKSNLIDAMRAAIPAASGAHFRVAEDDVTWSTDVARGSGRISVRRTYRDLTATELGMYAPALVDGADALVQTTTIGTDPDLPRWRQVDHRVGKAGLADPEPDQRHRVQHVYLPPLRDAQGQLDSGRGTRLRDMFRAAAPDEQRDAFEAEANEALGQLAGHAAARAVLDEVKPHLEALTAPVDGRVVDLRHERRGLVALLRSLRLHMAAHGFEPSSLGSSGLGYANVLFVATVVLELIRAQHVDLMLLLVEEPEAHLHP